MSLQLNARSEFDSKLEKEIAKIREDAQRDLLALKETSREISDREMR
jgi:hypothetical protein